VLHMHRAVDQQLTARIKAFDKRAAAAAEREEAKRQTKVNERRGTQLIRTQNFLAELQGTTGGLPWGKAMSERVREQQQFDN